MNNQQIRYNDTSFEWKGINKGSRDECITFRYLCLEDKPNSNLRTRSSAG